MYLKLFYALNINLNLAAAFIKLSLLFQFLRVFDRGTWPHRASVGGIVFVSLWGITFVILAVFPCTVIPDAWNIFARDAHCWGYGSQDPDLFTATFVSHNLINTLLDIYITAIPFQLYTRPDVTLRTRLGLMVLLLMGATYVLRSSLSLSLHLQIPTPKSLTRATKKTALSLYLPGACRKPSTTRRAGTRRTTPPGTAP